jgi:hypothetical protein
MSYGTPNYRTEATMFDLYDDSASAVLAEESGNCQLDSTCVSEQFHWRCRRIQHHGGGPDAHERLLAQGEHGGVRGWLQHVARGGPPRVNVGHWLLW